MMFTDNLPMILVNKKSLMIYKGTKGIFKDC